MVRMDKKKIGIIIGVIVAIIIVALLILFGIKNEVSFETVGGSLVESQKVRLFGKATKPADPTREGYTFDNWYLNDKVFDFDSSITSNIKLVARWAESGKGTYTVTFNSDGGSNVSAVKTDENGKISKPEDPEREGYKFVSWQYEGEDFDFSHKVTSNMTLKAKWEKDSATVADTKFKINSGNISLTVGGTKRLSTLNGSGKVTWSSSNTKVASVDANGTVRAIAPGTAVIMAKSGSDSSVVSVTVRAKQPTQPTQPEKPVDPIDPTPVDPEPVKVTYTYLWTPVANSAAGEEILTIRGSDGKDYAGTVRVTMQSGNVLEYDITAAGRKFTRSAVQSVTVVSPN